MRSLGKWIKFRTLSLIQFETISTYENKEYGFAFHFPADWHQAYAISQDGLMNMRVKAPDPDADPAGLEPNFEVSVYNTEDYLDPTTMEVKSGTTQGYAASNFNDLEYWKHSRHWAY